LPHFFLGVVHAKQGRFDAAVASYETALALDPRFFPSLHNLGSIHFILGNSEQALHYFKAALARLKEDPNHQWDAEEKEMKVAPCPVFASTECNVVLLLQRLPVFSVCRLFPRSSTSCPGW
jgi:tetratricopeptide (TPR) repeat protein